MVNRHFEAVVVVVVAYVAFVVRDEVMIARLMSE